MIWDLALTNRWRWASDLDPVGGSPDTVTGSITLYLKDLSGSVRVADIGEWIGKSRFGEKDFDSNNYKFVNQICQNTNGSWMTADWTTGLAPISNFSNEKDFLEADATICK